MIPECFLDGVEYMSDRIESLEKENSELRKANQRLSEELDKCNAVILGMHMRLEVGRRRLNEAKSKKD